MFKMITNTSLFAF